jgi:hypothetical protein
MSFDYDTHSHYHSELKCFSPLDTVSQDFHPLPLHKTKYGEVTTPFSIIQNKIKIFFV